MMNDIGALIGKAIVSGRDAARNAVDYSRNVVGSASGYIGLAASAGLALAVVTGISLAPTQAQAQVPPCGDRKEMSGYLARDYNEAQSGVGLTSNGSTLGLYTSPSGSWTAVQSVRGGPACITGTGELWQNTPLIPFKAVPYTFKDPPNRCDDRSKHINYLFQTYGQKPSEGGVGVDESVIELFISVRNNTNVQSENPSNEPTWSILKTMDDETCVILWGKGDWVVIQRPIVLEGISS